jgi:Fe-Mn family superoxide dismutase
MSDRRDFLKKSALLGLTGLAANMIGKEQLAALHESDVFAGGDDKKITLPALPYAYDALEPFIDKQTMEIHHTKHHQAYIDKLNTVPASEFNSGADLAESCRKIDQNSSALLRNNLGGHYNHQLFWTLLKPNPSKKQNQPIGNSSAAITKTFKSFDEFTKEFNDKALKIFGSGWCWLTLDANKNLRIVTTSNQDNPLMPVASDRGTPILGLDVWEHAYYLKYQNKRTDYINNWWNVVNWERVEQLFNA